MTDFARSLIDAGEIDRGEERDDGRRVGIADVAVDEEAVDAVLVHALGPS